MKKTVLITGGTRGIGKALAIKYASLGYNVAVTYKFSDDEALKLNTNYNVFTIKADVKNYAQAENCVSKVVEKFGNINLLINNAGVATAQKLLLDVTEDEFNEIIGVNLKGVFNYSKAVIPYMLSNGGVIVNVSSIQGIQGGSCEVVYSSSKAGVIGFTRALAEELENSNISIFAVAPTLTDTDMNAHLSMQDKLEFISSQNLTEIPTAEYVANQIYNLTLNAENLRGKTIDLAEI